jgi:hypothetical protein
MKRTITALGLALGLVLPCAAQPGAAIIVSGPSVAVATPPMAPTTYVYDGTEYVGMVGSQYYYLAPGNVWLPVDTMRLHRFQTWQTGHPNWRTHATRNLRYKNMGHVKPQPMSHRVPVPPNSDVINHPPQVQVTPGSYGPPQ